MKRVAVFIGYIVDEDVDFEEEVDQAQHSAPPPSMTAPTTSPVTAPGFEMPFDDVPW